MNATYFKISRSNRQGGYKRQRAAIRLDRGPVFRGGGYLLSHFRSIIGVARFNFSVRDG